LQDVVIRGIGAPKGIAADADGFTRADVFIGKAGIGRATDAEAITTECGHGGTAAEAGYGTGIVNFSHAAEPAQAEVGRGNIGADVRWGEQGVIRGIGAPKGIAADADGFAAADVFIGKAGIGCATDAEAITAECGHGGTAAEAGYRTGIVNFSHAAEPAQAEVGRGNIGADVRWGEQGVIRGIGAPKGIAADADDFAAADVFIGKVGIGGATEAEAITAERGDRGTAAETGYRTGVVNFSHAAQSAQAEVGCSNIGGKA